MRKELGNKRNSKLLSDVESQLLERNEELIRFMHALRMYARKDLILKERLLFPLIFIKRLLYILSHPIKYLKYKVVRRAIKKARVFQQDYYMISNPDVAVTYVDLLKHFILHGWKENRNPSTLFDVNFYINQYPDVKMKGMNPLYHFVKYGLKEGRKPSANSRLFDMYRHQYKPSSRWNLTYKIKLLYQIIAIRKSGRFNKDWYWNEYPDVYQHAQTKFLWKFTKSPSNYLRKCANLFTHPLWHYLQHGVYEGRDPTPYFDTKFYINTYPDVVCSKLNPFYHYCVHGQHENRLTYNHQERSLNKLKDVTKSDFISIYQAGLNEVDTREPLVTIIVPNYNHAPYLKYRLESIYNQTYSNYEVLLLDDCSQDDSREILMEYYNKYPEKTRIVFNEINSGGVFFQWMKGLSLAKGDLIWIAESDDWCTDNFLEVLVPFFYDEAVMLAYSQTIFVDQNGKQTWTIQEYLADIDVDFWKHPFITTADQLVKHAFAVKNVIPNVSSAVFRKPSSLSLLNDESWKSMRIAGDWIFYLHVIRGGLVSYSNNATNYYRIHNKNTSVNTYAKDIYYREHATVSKCIAQLYEVEDEVFTKKATLLKRHWMQTRGDFSEDQFSSLYNLDEILILKENRLPNLLMVSYSFSSGGGETFPIYLANLFKEKGYAVTFLCCDQTGREQGIRNMLRKDIPVINNYRLLHNIMNDFGVKVIHSHHAWVDGSIMDILPEEMDYAHVITLHGMYETIDKKDFKKIAPRLVSRTAKFVYIADKNLNPFIENSVYKEEKFVKIGNAISVDRISPVNLSEYGISNDAFVVCLVSRAIPEKGWQEAIESVSVARKISNKDIHLLLVGDGPEYVHLSKCKLPDYVHLLGFRSNVENYFAASDIGILPTRFRGESYPLVLISCLIAGKPMISTDIGEVESMLRGRNNLAGSIFRLNNWKVPIEEVASLIAKYATDKEFYASKLKEVPYAADKFSIDKLFARYDSVYLETVKNGSHQ